LVQYSAIYQEHT